MSSRITVLGEGDEDKSHGNSTSKPTVILPLNNQIAVEEGKTLLIHCTARGRPQPKIRWLRNKEEVTSQNRDPFGISATDRRKNQSIQNSANERISRLQIKDISIADSGNYTCRAENEHGSIQKWVFIAVQSRLQTTPPVVTTIDPLLAAPDMWKYKKCTDQTCLNGGACQTLHEGYRCHCLPAYDGENCEFSKDAFSNSSDVTCGGRILDCLRRTDRVLTGTGIGLAISAFLLILLLSWYMARQRRRDYTKFQNWKKTTTRFKSVQVGTPLYLQKSIRTVGCDVEHDLCVIETPPNYNLDSSPARSRGADGCSTCLDDDTASYIARSQTFPSNEYTPVGATGSAHVACTSGTTVMLPGGYQKSATLQHPRRSCSPHSREASSGPTTADDSSYDSYRAGQHLNGTQNNPALNPGFYYRPLRSLPAGDIETQQVNGGGLEEEEYHRVVSADFGLPSRRRRNYERDGTPESEIWIRRSLSQNNPNPMTETTEIQIVALPPAVTGGNPDEITYQHLSRPRMDRQQSYPMNGTVTSFTRGGVMKRSADDQNVSWNLQECDNETDPENDTNFNYYCQCEPGAGAQVVPDEHELRNVSRADGIADNQNPTPNSSQFANTFL